MADSFPQGTGIADGHRVYRELRQRAGVINVKADQDRIKGFLAQTGFYESFHMNKKRWVSIILDDTLPDDRIHRMVDDSYRIQG